MTSDLAPSDRASTDRASGFALILGGLITALVLGFHPSGGDIIDAAARGSAGSTTLVHALAIVAEVMLAFGSLALAARLRDERTLSTTALVSYAFGTVALIIAAVASGWLAPGALEGQVGPQGEVTDIGRALFHFSGEINRAFAAIGFSLVAVAIALWSVAMLRLGLSRWLGFLGLAVAAVVLVGIGSGHGLALHGLGGITMLGQLAWLVGAGALLLGRPRAR